MHKIGLIGGGNMGEAIISRVRHKYFVSVAELDKARAEYLQTTYKLTIGDIKSIVPDSDVIIVAVKPQDIETTLKEISQAGIAKQLIISIAAGVTTLFIEKTIAKRVRVIRTMPNMAVMVGRGITAVCSGRYAGEKDIDMVRKIFEHLGKTVIVDEDKMDAVTAVSGSGPAYVFLFMEYLMKASGELGLTQDLSKKLVEATLAGSIQLLEEKKIDPGTLREKVTSKGGTTEAALEVFKANNFEKIVLDALTAARKRAGELSRKA